MKILYRDDHIIVCIKPSGAVSMDEPGGMPDLIRQAIGEACMVRTVHRLDSVVSGLMVYALSKETASHLTGQMEDGTFGKEYMAVLEGIPEKDQGELRDYLYRSKRDRKTFVTDGKNRNAQEAILFYRTLQKLQDMSLVRVKLITGRTHQIRCQFSFRGLPLYGDGKYGSKNGNERIALWSCHLSFRHPVSGEWMEFHANPPEKTPWDCFHGCTESYEERDLVVEFQRKPSFSDCRYAEDCGFCTYQGVDYEKQLEKKQRKSTRWVREFGPVESILPMDNPTGYRNKLTVDMGTDKSGKPISGVYSRKTRKVMRIGKCPINHPKLEEILSTFRLLLSQYSIPIYDEQKNRGLLRQVILRITTAGEVMLSFTAADELPASAVAMVNALVTAHPEIRSVQLTIQSGKGRAQGNHKVLYGDSTLQEHWMGQEFQLAPDTYFPLNPVQNEKVYALALDAAALTGTERVLDAACGSGILALAAAASAGRILAVDGSADAVAEAKARAKEAHAENVRIIHNEPADYLDALAKSHEKFDILFFEATRGRNTETCITSVGRLKPEKVIYIGRDPEQLGQDVKQLSQYGYKVARICPVDIMPYTEHIETVVLLSKKEVIL